MAEFNWTVDDIERAQRDFSYNFMRLDCIRTESYDIAIDCMTECIEKKSTDVLPVKLILQIVQGRLNGIDYIMTEAIKSNDTPTAYKMKGAKDICNEILADLKALTAKDGNTNG